jgi:hypothetical protein
LGREGVSQGGTDMNLYTANQFKHGRNGYIRHGCRCDTCEYEQKKYRLEYKKKCFDSKNFKHGRVGYVFHKCRCDVCREAWRVYVSGYRKKNPDKMEEYRKKYRASNPEKIVAKNRRNSDRLKRLRDANPEEFNRRARAWRLENLDLRRKVEREYANKRRHEDLNFRLKNNLRSRVVRSLHNNCKSAHTAELTGCSIEELRGHLEKGFKAGMNWDNYGKWHIDHILPCASFDLTKAEEQARCFHFSNLQPLWARENMAKGDKLEGYL